MGKGNGLSAIATRALAVLKTHIPALDIKQASEYPTGIIVVEGTIAEGEHGFVIDAAVDGAEGERVAQMKYRITPDPVCLGHHSDRLAISIETWRDGAFRYPDRIIGTGTAPGAGP